jgi:hypothetical protein
MCLCGGANGSVVGIMQTTAPDPVMGLKDLVAAIKPFSHSCEVSSCCFLFIIFLFYDN